MTNSSPQLHPFIFYNAPRHVDRGLRVHQLRDGAAAWHLSGALLGEYRPGEIILNTPPRTPRGESTNADPQLVLAEGFADDATVSLDFLGAGDALLQTTRIPLDDATDGAPRKLVHRGHTDVEEALFDAWRPYLSTCSRLEVVLSEAVGQQLPDAYRAREAMTFHERAGAAYKALESLEDDGRGELPDKRSTALFLLRLDEMWPGGPGLVAAFGMDGIMTLVWAYRLAHDQRHLLQRRGLTMVEIELGKLPQRPYTMDWCAEWSIRKLVHAGPLPMTRASTMPSVSPTTPQESLRRGGL